MSLDQFIYHLERSNLFRSIDDIKQSKKECLSSIKILNSISKDKTTTVPHIKTISEFTLNYYDSISKPSSVSDKLTWLSSKFGGNFYPPVIQFDKSLSSYDPIFASSTTFEDDDEILQQLPTKSAEYKRVTVNKWDNEIANLKNLYQDILPNCSFVSSFLAIVDNDNDIHIINSISPHHESCQYKVMLHFNGERRVVMIDNKLPLMALNPTRNLIIKSYTDEQLYWPALIEKSYLKIMGNGYIFNGSNMANDTYLLSGWLPQIIRLENSRLPDNMKELWELKEKGEVVLGIGTGTLSKTLSHTLNLVTEHDYMIEHYNDKDGSITIKNPWLDQSKRIITIKEFTYFRFLYVNWKNTNTPFVQNFIYSVKPFVFHQPQFTIRCIEETTQVLLERHLPEDKEEGNQWMDINVYDTEYKVITPTQYKKCQSVQTNNRLQMITLKPGIYTMVISSNKPGKFTLSSFGASFVKSKYKYEFTESINDEWTLENNGGNWAMSTYINNPQYDFVIKELTDLVIGMYATGQINFHVLHSEYEIGQRIRRFDKTKLDNYQNYNSRFQLQNYRLSPGSYKLVVSEFQRNLGEYSLILNSNNPISISKIPQSLGLYVVKHSFNWDNNNRYKLYFQTFNHNSQVTFKICYFNGDLDYELQINYRPAVRASLFNAKTKQPIQINENFDDSLFGIFIDELLVDPDEYILLIERFEIGYGKCEVDIGCNNKVVILN
ncbi:RIM13 Calpain-like protease palB/RIM13 [Candida maltosa Xu316]|uniref:Cysteine protease RIM13 n=1 Tax=Candida maltosa (strain Xu316) TaxID=1245528 RepID=M3HKH3_CANMX|nr:hypothetical protein G210_1635 [Candida maltosa Xu316]